ncbi:MAG: TRAP transporter substrate-binding protein, partial [Lachnospiraceae bacterium]|nr:TRAP transporter substrate-binding protein [Lachnospiraceae bacterium]
PDILLGNYAFLEGLSEEERAIFDEGFELLNQVQREEWTKAVEAAKEKAQNDQGVEFIYPDTAPFQEACAPLHEEVINGNETLEAIYAKIQEYNAMYPSAAE